MEETSDVVFYVHVHVLWPAVGTPLAFCFVLWFKYKLDVCCVLYILHGFWSFEAPTCWSEVSVIEAWAFRLEMQYCLESHPCFSTCYNSDMVWNRWKKWWNGTHTLFIRSPFLFHFVSLVLYSLWQTIIQVRLPSYSRAIWIFQRDSDFK